MTFRPNRNQRTKGLRGGPVGALAARGADEPENGRNAEERIIAHPLIQAEFRRQQADLSELERLAKHPSEESAGIARLRRRAKSDAQTFFGSSAA